MVAVTKIGNPVNTDDFERSVNKMKTVKIQKSIKYTIVDLAVSVVLFFLFSFFLKTSCFSVQWDKNTSLFTRLWLVHEWEQEPRFMCVSEWGPHAGVVVNHARKYQVNLHWSFLLRNHFIPLEIHWLTDRRTTDNWLSEKLT